MTVNTTFFNHIRESSTAVEFLQKYPNIKMNNVYLKALLPNILVNYDVDTSSTPITIPVKKRFNLNYVEQYKWSKEQILEKLKENFEKNYAEIQHIVLNELNVNITCYLDEILIDYTRLETDVEFTKRTKRLAYLNDKQKFMEYVQKEFDNFSDKTEEEKLQREINILQHKLFEMRKLKNV